MDFQGFVSGSRKPIFLSAYDTRETIIVPKSASFIFLKARSAGGNGGAGFTRTAGSAGGGGGGGGAGVCRIQLSQASLFNGNLNVQFGATGSINVYVNQSIVLILSPGLGGGAGTSVAAGLGGAPGSVTANGAYFLFIGVNTIASTSGGLPAGGAGNSVSTSTLNGATGGAGGAGCTTTDFAGGSNSNVSPAIFGAVAAGGTAGGGNGENGFWLENVEFSLGGAGGGSNNSGVGGRGGSGGYGAGGGGGGAGATGGAGGTGGPPLLLAYFL